MWPSAVARRSTSIAENPSDIGLIDEL